jgi:hypothetical protein
VPRDQHHRPAARGPPYLKSHPRYAVGVHAAGGLVEDQKVRVGQQGLGHQRALRVTARERVQGHRGRVRQAEPGEQVPGAARGLIAAKTRGPRQTQQPALQRYPGQYPGPFG